MVASSSEINPKRRNRSRRQLLEDTLFRYLQADHDVLWPGADGLTLHDVLDCYLEASTHGRIPGLQELSRLHPDLRDELKAFFREVIA